jgi:hypothetical protein
MVIPIAADFQGQPTYPQAWTGKSEKPKAELDAKVARSRPLWYGPPREFGPYSRRYDDPPPAIDKEGWLFPPPHYHPHGEGDS